MRAGLRAGGGGLWLDQVHPAIIICPGPRVRRPMRGEEPVEVGPKKVRVDGARGPAERLEEGVFAGVRRQLGPAEEPLGMKTQQLDAHRELADRVELIAFRRGPQGEHGGFSVVDLERLFEAGQLFKRARAGGLTGP